MALGLRAAARELGISHVALHKAEKAGRVKQEPNGGFDIEKCRKALAENSNPEKQRQARSQRKSPATSQNAESGEHTYSEALRRREWLKVEKEELSLERQRGELVELTPINAFVAGMILKAQEELLRIGPELRDRLAQETDSIKCEGLVTAKIEQALNHLAQYRG